MLSPYVEDGIGKTDNESGQWEINDWWCEPDDLEYSEEQGESVAKSLPTKPKFLTLALSNAAQAERRRLKLIGDAPQFLGKKVLAWARRSPRDGRVPEALYITIEANGWTKYGCGNNEELREELLIVLQKNYPNSEWTAKLKSEENEN